MQVKVRRIAARDRARWLDLFRGYIAFYEAVVPGEVIEETWRRLMTGGEGDHIGLVAVDGTDAATGLAHILFHRSTWSRTGYCYLEDLYVEPACRGQGAGAALIQAAYREADAWGATRTYWVTRDDNAVARSLYDRMATLAPFVQYRR